MAGRIIYQAGPLFSDAERQWHKTAKAKFESAGLTVVWPGDLITEKQIENAGISAPSLIFKVCKEALDACNCVVALLDGTQVDDGTAWEIGYAYAKGKPVYGIRTDSRVAGDTQFSHVNSMIEGCLTGLASTLRQAVELLKKTE